MILPFRIHICVTIPHTKQGVMDHLISDIRNETAKILKNPNAKAGKQVSIFCHSLQESLFIGAESPPSNYYIGGSTCMTSMYRVIFCSK